MEKKPSRGAGSSPAEAPPPGWAVELGAVVRARRKQLRLTQRQLAELSNCGPDFLYDLERGKPTLQLAKLVAVLDALGMKLKVEVASQAVGASTAAADWVLAGPTK